jgi:gluconate kinase
VLAFILIVTNKVYVENNTNHRIFVSAYICVLCSILRCKGDTAGFKTEGDLIMMVKLILIKNKELLLSEYLNLRVTFSADFLDSQFEAMETPLSSEQDIRATNIDQSYLLVAKEIINIAQRITKK